MALILAAKPFPVDVGPWQRARQRFLDGLSPEQRLLFDKEDFTVESLYYATDVSHQAHLGLAAFSTKLKPLTTGLEEFGKAMDVYANAASLVLSPLWGSVRVLLVLAQRIEKHQTELMDLLEHIGDLLPAYRDLTGLFGDEKLNQLLTDAYLSILVVCVDIKDSLLKGSKAKVSWKMFHHSLLKSSEFGPHLSRLRKQKNAVIERAAVVSMLEQDKRAKAKRKKRLLDMLSTVDYSSRHILLLSERHAGTCSWYLQSPEFRAWFDGEHSAVLCCFGIPGCGKSVLSSAVIEFVSNMSTGLPIACCYLHCDSRNQETLDLAKLFGCICRQMLLQREIPKDLAKLIEQAHAEFRKPDVADLRAILELLCRDLRQVYICIDGLDELDQSSRARLIQQIETLLVGKCRVKIHLTCREDASLTASLQSHSSLMLTRSSVADDLERFTVDAVSQLLRDKTWAARSPQLESEISAALVQKAKDMFLWVRLQLDEIGDCDSEAQVRSVLNDLPENLASTYDRIITKIASSPNGSRKLETAVRTLQWVFCAQRPMTVDELEEAVSLDHGTQRLDMTKIPRDDGLMLRKACGNLLTFNQQSRTLTVIHPSVQQYLLESRSQHIRLRYQQAQEHVTELCLVYLSLEDFDRQVTAFDPPRKRLNASTIGALVDNASKAMPSKMLGKLTKHSIPALSKQSIDLAVVTNNDNHSTFDDDYRLLSYVVPFWTKHCANLDKATAIRWHMFVSVALDRRMPFEHRPWVTGGPSQNRLLEWCLEMNYPSFLHLVQWDATRIRQAIQSGCRKQNYGVILYIVSNLGGRIPAQDNLLPQCVAALALMCANMQQKTTPQTTRDDPTKRAALEEALTLLAKSEIENGERYKRGSTVLEEVILTVGEQSKDVDLIKAAVDSLSLAIVRLSGLENGRIFRDLYLGSSLTWRLCNLFLVNNMSNLVGQRMIREAVQKHDNKFIDSIIDNVAWDTTAAALELVARGEEITLWPDFVAALKNKDFNEIEAAMERMTAACFFTARHRSLAMAVQEYCASKSDKLLYEMYMLWGVAFSVSKGRLRLMRNSSFSFVFSDPNPRYSSLLDSAVLATIVKDQKKLDGVSISMKETRFIANYSTPDYETLALLTNAEVPNDHTSTPLRSWAFFLLFLVRSSAYILTEPSNIVPRISVFKKEANDGKAQWLDLIRISSLRQALVLTRVLRACWIYSGLPEEAADKAEEEGLSACKAGASLADGAQASDGVSESHARLQQMLLDERQVRGSAGHLFFQILRNPIS